MACILFLFEEKPIWLLMKAARQPQSFRKSSTIVEDADPDIPILKQAKAEYAKWQ
jgi:hypothetical protein